MNKTKLKNELFEWIDFEFVYSNYWNDEIFDGVVIWAGAYLV